MLTYDTIKMLCKRKGVTVTGLEKELGFARGSLCKVNTNKPSMEKVQKIADFFGTSVEYLMSGEETEDNETALTTRDERDIKKSIDKIMENIENKEGAPLYYDGVEVQLTDINKDLLRNALNIALSAVKIENKEKYNPHKNGK